MDNSGYEKEDPKHPDFYGTHVDIWDNRDRFVGEERAMALDTKKMSIEELCHIHWQAAQEIDKRGGRMDSYAAPHVWNLVAKILREQFSDFEQDVQDKLVERNKLIDVALAFAKRFAEDDGFDPIAWLDKCSPDPDLYPLSELWDEH